MDQLISTIMGWGPVWAPRSWALCQGQLLAISTNTALFSLIGTLYGGDGRTTFALPDLRGRTPIGQGNGPGLTPRIVGQRSGFEFVTLNVLEIPAHSHAASVQVHASTQPGTQSVPGTNGATTLGASISGGRAAELYNSDGNPAQVLNTGANNVAVGNTGGNQSHENMQPFLVISWIIALEGIFPSRN